MVGFHDILNARTIKVFDLSVSLFSKRNVYKGLWGQLEAMAGRNTLEAFFFEVRVNDNVTEGLVGSILQQVEEVLVKPAWIRRLY